MLRLLRTHKGKEKQEEGESGKRSHIHNNGIRLRKYNINLIMGCKKFERMQLGENYFLISCRLSVQKARNLNNPILSNAVAQCGVGDARIRLRARGTQLLD